MACVIGFCCLSAGVLNTGGSDAEAMTGIQRLYDSLKGNAKKRKKAGELFVRTRSSFHSRALGAPSPLCGWLAAAARTKQRYHGRQPFGRRATTPQT